MRQPVCSGRRSTASFIYVCLSLGLELVTAEVDSNGRDVAAYSKLASETFVYFLHVPKSGGTYMHCIAASAGMQEPPHSSNNLFCNEYYKAWCPTGLNQRRVPFWSWPEETQISFFSTAAQPSNFIENEAGLGEEMVESGTSIADPVDRAVSNFVFMSASHGKTLEQWSQRMSHRDSEFEAQMMGADMNKATQMLAGWGACGDTTPRDEEPRFAVVCNSSAAETAKERLSRMDVVLILEWLHLSGPLLCKEFGWCRPEVLSDLSVRGDACGGRETLAAAGLQDFAAELEDRFKVDSAVYEHAKEISRKQLAAVGVIVPGPHAVSADRGMAGVCGDDAKGAAGSDPKCDAGDRAHTKPVCKPPDQANRNVDKKKCRVRPS